MAFLDSNYLLGSSAAQRLYPEVAALPVVDPHNHADVKRIADNVPFTDPWELFAATDHYVWEMLRKCGVSEELITGSASNYEKWLAMAKVFPDFAGNPVYEWVHLDLRFLGFDNILLCEDTAETLWTGCCEALAKEENLPQNLIRRMNIETMCSTDDPADTLEEHDRANAAFGKTLIRPTWRPDRVMKIRKADFCAYLEKLSLRWDKSIKSVSDLIDVLKKSHDFFAAHGAIASDHGVEKPYDGLATEAQADAILQKMLSGGTATAEDEDVWSSYLMRKFAEFDAEKGWCFQLHMGAVRDVRDVLYATLGPDTGGDVSDHVIDIVKPLCKFLNIFDEKLKVVLYCLEPAHQASLATVSRSFGTKVRLGSAWWFNDTPIGMKRQLEYISSVDLFSAFAGMVSDSRKLLSYSSRFEMFRRVLCDVIGDMVEHGRIPEDTAKALVRKMSYSGPKSFYGLN